jgi:outer membrane biosynthesis protein TonB
MTTSYRELKVWQSSIVKRIKIMVFIAAALIPASAVGQVCTKQISVPDYPPIAVAAQWKGTVDLAITVGPQGQVLEVEGKGLLPVLLDHAKANVKNWVFCAPNNKRSAHVQLRYDYRLLGAPVYPLPTPRVVIDLGAGTITITSPPMEPQD